MTPDEIVNALRAHRREMLEQVTQLPAGTAEVLAQSLPGMDTESREMLVSLLAHTRDSHAGELLLKLTQDREGTVSVAAAHGLIDAPSRPSLHALLAAAAHQAEPLVRGNLYLAAGMTGDTAHREALHTAMQAEGDPSAMLNAQAALVRLGDPLARTAFLTELQTTEPDDAMEALDRLLYIHDRQLARALIPWFANEEPVIGVGLGSSRRMARMCDVAAWAAHQLDIAFVPAPQKLDIYDVTLLHRALAAVRALPQ